MKKKCTKKLISLLLAAIMTVGSFTSIVNASPKSDDGELASISQEENQSEKVLLDTYPLSELPASVGLSDNYATAGVSGNSVSGTSTSGHDAGIFSTEGLSGTNIPSVKPQTLSESGQANAGEVMYEFRTVANGCYGVATDGEYIYTSCWTGARGFDKYTFDGTFVETFYIEGIPKNTRGMTYDGEFFYCINSTNTVYVVDFAERTFIRSFTVPLSNVTGITYDVDDNTIWVSFVADSQIIECDLDGIATGRKIKGTLVGGMVGIAYDSYSNPDDPTMWIFTNGYGETMPVVEFSVATSQKKRMFDIVPLSFNKTGSAGGLSIYAKDGIAYLLTNLQTSPNEVRALYLTDVEITDPLVVTEANINITAPAALAVPETATPYAREYSGEITWSPAIPANGKFGFDTAYSADVKLTALENCSFANNVTIDVPGAGLSNIINTGVTLSFTATFPNTRHSPEGGTARVTLDVPYDVFGTSTGYQMLIDSSATSYGTIIPPTHSSLTQTFHQGDDVPDGIYNAFDYKIPFNATGNLNDRNFVLSSSITIDIPSGVYDYALVSPWPNDRMWIGYTEYGRFDDFIFEDGINYTFSPYLDLITYNDIIELTTEPMSPVQGLTAANVLVTAPEAGKIPQIDIWDDGSDFWNEGYVGYIDWTPSLPDTGRFDYETAYSANVTLMAQGGYEFNPDAEAAVNAAKLGNVVNTGERLSFTVTFPATQERPEGKDGFARVILATDDPFGDHTGLFLCLDSTATASEKDQPYLDYDFDYFVPKNALYQPYYYHVIRGSSEIIVPNGVYDLQLINPNWSGQLRTLYKTEINFEAGKTYLYQVHERNLYIYELTGQVLSAASDSAQIPLTGGTSTVTFEGKNIVASKVGVFLEGALVTDSWATGKYTSGSDTKQSVTLDFPADTASAGQVYTVKIAPVGGENWNDTAAAITVGDSTYATVTLTVGNPYGDGTGYQLLLDGTATANGSQKYDSYQHFIPENCAINKNLVVWNGSQTIEVPGGTYDLFLANHLGSNFYTPFIFDNVKLEAGHSYEFDVSYYRYYTVRIDGVTAPTNTIVPITAPVGLGTPQNEIVETDYYTGTISWFPNDTVFAYDVAYSANVVLNAKSGVNLSFVDILPIPGITFSNKVITKDRVSFTQTFQKTYEPDRAVEVTLTVGDPFGDGTGYQMMLDATATAGVSYDHNDYQYFIPEDGWINYNSSVYNASRTITVPSGKYNIYLSNYSGFTYYDNTRINNFEFAAGHKYEFKITQKGSYTLIIDGSEQLVNVQVPIARPVTLAKPQTTVAENGQYTGTITWNPSHEAFNPAMVYAANVVLTAKPGYSFANPAVSVPGATISNRVYTTDTLSFTATFPKTGEVFGEGYARIVVSAGNLWGDGVGVAMLLDSTATISKDFINASFDDCDYFVPENLLTDPQHIFILNGSAEIIVPAGVYDWCLKAINGIGGTSASGAGVTFVSGHTYTFTVTPNTMLPTSVHRSNVAMRDYPAVVTSVNSVELTKAGGSAEIAFNGNYLVPGNVGLFLDGELIKTVRSAGDAATQNVTLDISANTTNADQIYQIKYDPSTMGNWSPTYATVTVKAGDVEEDAKLVSVTADNAAGKLTIKLSDVLSNTPVPEDFVITWSGGLKPLDSKQELKNYTFAGDTATFDFTPYLPCDQDQNVVFTVKYREITMSAEPIFIAKLSGYIPLEDVDIVFITPASVSVAKSKTVQLKVETDPYIDVRQVPYSLTWKSLNTSVAAVNSSGVVTGKAAGMTMVHATITDPYGTAIVLEYLIMVK